MTETVSSEEAILGRRIRVYADAGAPLRDPGVVVRAILAKPPRHPLRMPLGLVAVASVLLIVIVAVGSLGQVGSRPARAHVGGITLWGINLGGTTYDLAVVRSIDFSAAQLTAVGKARHDGGFRTEGSTVYRLDDVDPQLVLVLKLLPGEYDDADSVGDYVVLVRGNGFSLLCPYFQPGDPLAPSMCD